ncbi:hypothetical protein HDU76_011662, partial [Blyttiomyces sp. JEL0837]
VLAAVYVSVNPAGSSATTVARFDTDETARIRALQEEMDDYFGVTPASGRVPIDVSMFSRGCSRYLIGTGTPLAKEFREWVLDALDEGGIVPWMDLVVGRAGWVRGNAVGIGGGSDDNGEGHVVGGGTVELTTTTSTATTSTTTTGTTSFASFNGTIGGPVLKPHKSAQEWFLDVWTRPEGPPWKALGVHFIYHNCVIFLHSRRLFGFVRMLAEIEVGPIGFNNNNGDNGGDGFDLCPTMTGWESAKMESFKMTYQLCRVSGEFVCNFLDCIAKAASSTGLNVFPQFVVQGVFYACLIFIMLISSRNHRYFIDSESPGGIWDTDMDDEAVERYLKLLDLSCEVLGSGMIMDGTLPVLVKELKKLTRKVKKGERVRKVALERLRSGFAGGGFDVGGTAGGGGAMVGADVSFATAVVAALEEEDGRPNVGAGGVDTTDGEDGDGDQAVAELGEMFRSGMMLEKVKDISRHTSAVSDFVTRSTANSVRSFSVAATSPGVSDASGSSDSGTGGGGGGAGGNARSFSGMSEGGDDVGGNDGNGSGGGIGGSSLSSNAVEILNRHFGMGSGGGGGTVLSPEALDFASRFRYGPAGLPGASGVGGGMGPGGMGMGGGQFSGFSDMLVVDKFEEAAFRISHSTTTAPTADEFLDIISIDWGVEAGVLNGETGLEGIAVDVFNYSGAAGGAGWGAGGNGGGVSGEGPGMGSRQASLNFMI